MSKYISKDLLVNKTYTAFDQQDLYLPTHFRDVIDEAEELTDEFEPSKSEVLKALEDVRSEIEARMKNYRKEQSEIIWDTADITNGIFEQTSYGQGLGLKEALEIIDRKVNEVTDE